MRKPTSTLYFLFFAIVLAVFVFAVRGNWSWLISENARLEPWEVPLAWAPLFMALVLFVEHGIRQMTGIQLVALAQKFTFRAFLISVVIECALGGFSIAEDWMGYNRSLRTAGQIISGRSRVQDEVHRRYTFVCSFLDQHHTRHTAWFSDTTDGISTSVRQAIDAKRIPSVVDVLYDPRLPGRTWLADVPYSQTNRLSIFFFLVLIFSLPMAGGLAAFHSRLPWLPAPGASPFLAATFVLLMAAVIQGW